MQNMSGGKTALGLDANVGALVCYLGNIICGIGGLIYSIIVVVQDKTNKLVRFHAFQSIFLSILGALVWIVYMVIFGVAFAIDLALGFGLFTYLAWLIVAILCLAVLAGWVFAAVKGYQGQIFKLPVIGNLAEKYS